MQGGFAGEEEAGRAHDVVALRTRGPTAILNYPSAAYRPVLHLLAQVSGVNNAPSQSHCLFKSHAYSHLPERNLSTARRVVFDMQKP